jgi:hypothetical protein
MSWSIHIVGTPTEVIEQLVNKPNPQGQDALGLLQFSGIRATLIEQVKAIRDNGLPEHLDGVVVSAGGHAQPGGTGNFGATISLTNLTPAPATVLSELTEPPASTTPESEDESQGAPEEEVSDVV